MYATVNHSCQRKTFQSKVVWNVINFTVFVGMCTVERLNRKKHDVVLFTFRLPSTTNNGETRGKWSITVETTYVYALNQIKNYKKQNAGMFSLASHGVLNIFNCMILNNGRINAFLRCKKQCRKCHLSRNLYLSIYRWLPVHYSWLNYGSLFLNAHQISFSSYGRIGWIVFCR